MLILLPNQCLPLSTLEQSLNTYDFSGIDQLLHPQSSVVLKLPKFKIESSLDLNEPLHQVSKRNSVIMELMS